MTQHTDRNARIRAYQAAQDAQDGHRFGVDPYDGERRVLHAIATAAGHGTRFVGVAADVLDTLRLDSTDVIRGSRDEFGAIPTAAAGPAGRDAQVALRILVAAADIPWPGDEEWTACIRLLEQARDLARAASRD